MEICAAGRQHDLPGLENELSAALDPMQRELYFLIYIRALVPASDDVGKGKAVRVGHGPATVFGKHRPQRATGWYSGKARVGRMRRG